MALGNTGHFDNEIDLADSEGLDDMSIVNIKPQVAPSVFPVGLSIPCQYSSMNNLAPLIKQFMQVSRLMGRPVSSMVTTVSEL